MPVAKTFLSSWKWHLFLFPSLESDTYFCFLKCSCILLLCCFLSVCSTAGEWFFSSNLQDILWNEPSIHRDNLRYIPLHENIILSFTGTASWSPAGSGVQLTGLLQQSSCAPWKQPWRPAMGTQCCRCLSQWCLNSMLMLLVLMCTAWWRNTRSSEGSFHILVKEKEVSEISLSQYFASSEWGGRDPFVLQTSIKSLLQARHKKLLSLLLNQPVDIVLPVVVWEGVKCV